MKTKLRKCFTLLLNKQGVVDSEGSLVVEYQYTAWGKATVAADRSANGIGTINPFRFKGYYYDAETAMYYCQTRYYVPSWGRWLNADSPVFLQPIDTKYLNLFIYCCNNPIMFVDGSGTLPKWAQWLILGVVAALAVVAVVVGTVATGGTGLLVAATATSKILSTALVGMGSGFLISAGCNLIEQSERYNGNLSNLDPQEAMNCGAQGAAIGAACTMFNLIFAPLGAEIGGQFGYNVAQHVVNGRKLSSIFGKTGLFIRVGEYIGRALGTVAGVALGNEIGGNLAGTFPGFVEDIKKGVANWIKSLIKKLIELF